MIVSQSQPYQLPASRCEVSRRVTDVILNHAVNQGQMLGNLVENMREQVSREVAQADALYAPYGPGYLLLVWVQPLRTPEPTEKEQT